MSKNMTRKGLAFGATLALSLAGLTSLPASAANVGPSVYPITGSSFGMIENADFDISIVIPAMYGIQDFGDSLRVAIEALDDNATTVDFELSAGSASADSADETDLNDGGSAGDPTVDGEVATLAVTDNLANDDLRTFNLDIAIGSVVDESSSFKITAWVDVDGSGGDAPNGDEVGTSKTLTIYDLDDLTYTLTVDPIQAADVNITGTISVAQSLNYSQLETALESEIEVGLAEVAAGVYSAVDTNPTTVSNAGLFTTGSDSTVTVDDNELDEWTWTQADGASVTTANGDVIAAQLVVDTGDTEVGSEVRATVFTTAITDIDLQMTESATVARSSGTEEAPNGWEVLEGTKSVTMTVNVFNTDISGSDDEVAYAGRSVSVSVNPTLDADSTVTVNGVEVTEAGGTEVVTGTTNASGQLRLTITSNSGEADDSLSITVTSEGTGTDTGDAGNATVTLTWVETAADTVSWLDAVGDNANFVIKPADKFTLNYGLTDTFGAPAGSSHRVKVVYNGSTKYTNAFAGGTVAIEITDTNTASTTEQVTAVVQVKSATTGNWSDTAVQVQHNVSVVATPKVAASLTAAVSDATDVAVETEAFAAGDNRVDGDFDPEYASEGTVLSGTVLSSASAGVQGAVVTITGTGLAFEASGKYTLDTITVRADSAGYFNGVTIRSKTGGTKTVTVTSGAATATVSIAFSGSAAISKDAKLTISAPSSATAGSVVSVEVTLVDENGNPLPGDEISFSNTGPGYLNSATAVTGANGKASVKLLVSASESGTATVTALVDYAAGKFLTQTATITIGGSEATAKIGSFNGRVAVRVENAKGSTISVKIGRSWYKYSALNDNYLKSWVSRKGASVAVSVYVDGELQNVQTITVK